MDEFDDFGYEPFEDDLQELGDREAWEDAQAEMEAEWEAEAEDWDDEMRGSACYPGCGYCGACS